MDAFWQYWNSLTPGVRDGVIAGIIGGIALAAILGVFKLFGIPLLTLVRGLLKAGARRIQTRRCLC
jgi:hypothetical protein